MGKERKVDSWGKSIPYWISLYSVATPSCNHSKGWGGGVCMTVAIFSPTLLLQDSVPHLKTRLQLQQVIMKELLQKIIAEKRNNSPVTPASVTAAGAPKTTPPTTNQLAASGGQPVTAVQVTPPLQPPPGGGSAASGKPATVAGSKVTVGAVIPNSSAAATQMQLPQTFSQAALDSLSVQLPKDIREKIAQLPKEQQKFVYMHHFRQVQQLKEQQKQQAAASSKVTSEKQQMPLVVGVAKSGAPLRSGSATVSVGAGTTDGKNKANFATMKIVPGVTATSLPGGASPGTKKKGKGKDNGPEIE